MWATRRRVQGLERNSHANIEEDSVSGDNELDLFSNPWTYFFY